MEINFNQHSYPSIQQTNTEDKQLSCPLDQTSPFQNNLNSISTFYQLTHFLQPFFYRVNCLEGQVQELKAEIEEIKKSKSEQQEPRTDTEIIEENTNVRRTYSISKEFTKHILCPVQGCRRRYSSKIAMRAHIRKNHKEVQLN